mgnify:CR=1 FL=1
MPNQVNQDTDFKLLTLAIVIALILGTTTLIFFNWINKDSYSSIYIVPDSIINNKETGTLLYTYGIRSYETGIMDYTLNVSIDGTIVKTKHFSLNSGQILDERDKISIPPDNEYPSKISLNLSTQHSIEEVHFWLTE